MKTFSTILEWLANLASIVTLIFAIFIYNNFNVASVIKQKETDIIFQLLNDINSKSIYIKNYQPFSLQTTQQNIFKNNFTESTLTAAINISNKNTLNNYIILDANFIKFLDNLKAKYLNQPIPKEIKSSIKECANISYYSQYIETIDTIYDNVQLITTDKKMAFTKKLIIPFYGSCKKPKSIKMNDYFKKWNNLHKFLLDWIENNSSIKPEEYFELNPTEEHILFDTPT
jgi:hypothetical protein